jgi:hypothetical protein
MTRLGKFLMVVGGVMLLAATILNLSSIVARSQTADAYNGFGVYSKPGLVAPVVENLKARGFKVGVRNHTEGKRTSTVRDMEVGHSMGGNAILKKAHRTKKKPLSIVTIDPGRAPLFHRCPKGIRCVNTYCPWHPIGGQYVEGAENIWDCSKLHGGMPYSFLTQAAIASEAQRVKDLLEAKVDKDKAKSK